MQDGGLLTISPGPRRADSAGRTMIAEMPAPQCVGASSPFLPSIKYVRSKFTSQFHPSDVWHRVITPVQIAGVGFFDFKHGQSGVAPNAIELHPVLRFSVGAGSSAPPPAPPVNKPQPTVRPSGSFSVRASVSPNPVLYGSYPALYAYSSPGAVCTASVLYSTGRAPVAAAKLAGPGTWSQGAVAGRVRSPAHCAVRIRVRRQASRLARTIGAGMLPKMPPSRSKSA
jgi:hypothetical protein